VTLDLSTPQSAPPQDEAKYRENSQGVGRLWVNKGVKNAAHNTGKRSTKKRTRMKGKKADSTALNNDPVPEEDLLSDEDQGSPMQDDQEDGNDIDNGYPTKTEAPSPASAQEIKAERPNKVQILDLHNKNPIVSYGDEIYACEWTRNIGTEFLFIEHDDQNRLPVLQHLSQSVDLICVSSIRLMSTPVILEPQFGTRRFITPKAGFNWTSGSVQSRSDKNQDQASFLEQLRAIKQRKGEGDDVTMITKKQSKNIKGGLRMELKKKRVLERRRLNNVTKGSKIPLEVKAAKQRLKAIGGEVAQNVKTSRKTSESQNRAKAGHGDGCMSIPAPKIKGQASSYGRDSTSVTNTQNPQLQNSVAQDWQGDDGLDEDDVYDDDDAPSEEDDTHWYYE
jgi:hypothetical protein